MQIASRLRQVRIDHSLSLETLALKSGLSETQLTSFEDGLAIFSMAIWNQA